MKKFGFTIAETLITLSIVGVVGTLTLPTFISNHRNQTNAATLAIATSNLENAITTYIMKENETNFRATNAGSRRVDNGFVASFEGVINLESTARTSSLANLYSDGLKDITGTNIAVNTIPNARNYVGLKAKNGVVYFFRKLGSNSIDEATVLRLGGALNDTWASVIIDVNGSLKPNTIGRDIFMFDLGNDGFLYPCGSLDYSIKNQNLSTTTWRDAQNNWQCVDGAITAPGFGCTARLIEENYRPTY